MNDHDQVDVAIHPYNRCALKPGWHIIIALVGAAVGAAVFWLFYRLEVLAFVGALITAPALVKINIRRSKKQRLHSLLNQFKDMLESLVVGLQAGSVDLAAFEHALSAMRMTYSDDTDIVKELTLIIKKFDNRTSIGEALMDFANRCGLDDVRLFANIYSSIEGKGDKTQEIVERTQKILSDKIAIQSEIQTMSSGAVMELNILIVIPIVIVGIMGYMGGELMEGLFTPMGRFVVTIAIGIFVGAYLIGKKITNIKV